MKKSVIFRLKNDGKIEVNVIDKKLLVGEDICECCYLRVRSSSENFSHIFNVAVDIKIKDEMNKPLTDAESEFAYGADCEYQIWVSKNLLGVELLDNTGSGYHFTLTKEDVKTPEQIAKKQLKKWKPKLFDTSKVKKEKVKPEDNKDNNSTPEKDVIDSKLAKLFGVDKLSFEVLTEDKLAEIFNKVMSGEKMEEMKDIANTVLQATKDGKLNTDKTWNDGMKKRTEDLLKILNKEQFESPFDVFTKSTEKQESTPNFSKTVETLDKGLCKIFNINYEDFKKFKDDFKSDKEVKNTEPEVKGKYTNTHAGTATVSEVDNNIYLVDIKTDIVTLMPYTTKEIVKLIPITKYDLERSDVITKDIYKFDMRFDSNVSRLIEFCKSFVVNPGKNKFYFTKAFIDSETIYNGLSFSFKNFDPKRLIFKLVKRTSGNKMCITLVSPNHIIYGSTEDKPFINLKGEYELSKYIPIYKLVDDVDNIVTQNLKMFVRDYVMKRTQPVWFTSDIINQSEFLYSEEFINFLSRINPTYNMVNVKFIKVN